MDCFFISTTLLSLLPSFYYSISFTTTSLFLIVIIHFCLSFTTAFISQCTILPLLYCQYCLFWLLFFRIISQLPSSIYFCLSSTTVFFSFRSRLSFFRCCLFFNSCLYLQVWWDFYVHLLPFIIRLFPAIYQRRNPHLQNYSTGPY